MQALTDRQLLDLCGRGRERHSVDRALLLLAAALPEEPAERLADLSIADRDSALFALRRVTFGQRLASYVDCAGCGERLEFELDPAALLGAGTPAPAAGVLQVGEWRFRIPTSRDLARIADATQESDAARRLAALCCIDRANESELSDAVIADLEAAFARADLSGNIQLSLDCPVCGRSWEEAFDIGEYLWEEVEKSAKRLLTQVHALASANGWSEPEILSLGAARRAMYLELVDA